MTRGKGIMIDRLIQNCLALFGGWSCRITAMSWRDNRISSQAKIRGRGNSGLSWWPIAAEKSRFWVSFWRASDESMLRWTRRPSRQRPWSRALIYLHYIQPTRFSIRPCGTICLCSGLDSPIDHGFLRLDQMPLYLKEQVKISKKRRSWCFNLASYGKPLEEWIKILWLRN